MVILGGGDLCSLEAWPAPIATSLARSFIPYLEGQWDLVSMLLMGITRVTIWVIGVTNLLTTSPDPPSTRILMERNAGFRV